MPSPTLTPEEYTAHFCCYCRWSYKKTIYMCGHPFALDPSGQYRKEASTMRESGQPCGPDGLLFEKDPDDA